jgi:hypothetical protein
MTFGAACVSSLGFTVGVSTTKYEKVDWVNRRKACLSDVYGGGGNLLLCPVHTLPLQVVKLRKGAHKVVRSTFDAVKRRSFLREGEAASGRAEKNHIAISAAIIALAPHTLLAFGNALHVGGLAADLLSVTLTH